MTTMKNLSTSNSPCFLTKSPNIERSEYFDVNATEDLDIIADTDTERMDNLYKISTASENKLMWNKSPERGDGQLYDELHLKYDKPIEVVQLLEKILKHYYDVEVNLLHRSDDVTIIHMPEKKKWSSEDTEASAHIHRIIPEKLTRYSFGCQLKLKFGSFFFDDILTGSLQIRRTIDKVLTNCLPVDESNKMISGICVDEITNKSDNSSIFTITFWVLPKSK